MNLIIENSHAIWGDFKFPCSVGFGGVGQKLKEGDGITPLGIYPLRRCFYRSDRVPDINTELDLVEINSQMGWCDDPKDPKYNKLVNLPFASGHEKMWRDDHIYDIVIEVGFNDSPVIPGIGSAIFIHLARDGFTPTHGCVGLKLDDLLKFLCECTKSSSLEVRS